MPAWADKASGPGWKFMFPHLLKSRFRYERFLEGVVMKVNKTIRIFNRATAIVTGAASGIGRGLAEELAKRGCEVVLADRQIRMGRLDYIFNNAGIGIGGNVKNFGIEDWNQMMDVNLRGIINGVQAAHKVMITQGFGHIVNTASLAGLMPSPGTASAFYARVLFVRLF
jgi:NADP-dependent 3-hydroxy acid dehydrogenase YdfG